MSVQSSERTAPQVESEILARGIETLRSMLPRRWRVEIVGRPVRPDAGYDAVVAVTEPGGSTSEVVVEIKLAPAPRGIQGFVGRLDLMRLAGTAQTALVLAPWLSARTRHVLDQHDVSYLDLTGNAHLRLDSPAVLISTTGAQKDPTPPSRRGGVTVRGDAAGRVVRFLVDVNPPHTATSIAAGADVSLPYVSRVLTALDREALVERGRRGVVLDVDWQALLRRRAESYSLFGTNAAQGYLSPTGARQVVERLREQAAPAYLAVTGSFAVVQRAPVAAPAQLVVHVDDPEQVAAVMGLLPTDQGADVVLVRPRDRAVLDRSEVVGGLRVVAPSQLVLDSLTGNGRMPAEGEALLAWMTDHEGQWRSSPTGSPLVEQETGR